MGMADEQEGIDRRIAHARALHPGSAIDCYVLFESHTDAMALYDAARQRSLSARVSPTPRAARASCGVALLVSCGDAAAIERVAQTEGISVENIVALPRQIDAHRDRYC